MAAGAVVGVLFEPEGVDGHGATARGGASQHTRARGVVDVQAFDLRSGIPTDEVIEQIVGEGGGGAAVSAVGDIAPAFIAAGVHLPCFVEAGSAGAIETGQFVQLAVAVEVLCWLLEPFRGPCYS